MENFSLQLLIENDNNFSVKIKTKVRSLNLETKQSNKDEQFPTSKHKNNRNNIH